MPAGESKNFDNFRFGRPAIIGIYGLPGSGKTFVLNRLSQIHGNRYIFTEGSEVISRQVPGGLEAFQFLGEDEKRSRRALATRTILADCLNERKAGVVTGHFMFWTSGNNHGISVWTQVDLKTYTHIIYLKPTAEVIHQRRLHDTSKSRSNLSIEHLRRWQQEEELCLRTTCYAGGIIYYALSQDSTLPKVIEIIGTFLDRR
jgi:adenylate kinase